MEWIQRAPVFIRTCWTLAARPQLNKSTDRKGSDYISRHIFFGRTFCGTCAKPKSATLHRNKFNYQSSGADERRHDMVQIMQAWTPEWETLTKERETFGLSATGVWVVFVSHCKQRGEGLRKKEIFLPLLVFSNILGRALPNWTAENGIENSKISGWAQNRVRRFSDYQIRLLFAIKWPCSYSNGPKRGKI